ncbi:hypothetical protein [Rhodococcus zopfii]|uniref:hypothetical protein n=1 Tax=Rhodococcus zopfii TaxID=43772 RepID=UPI001114AEEE|nr:hypothetical protein [Rhodococcus zopfii]
MTTRGNMTASGSARSAAAQRRSRRKSVDERVLEFQDVVALAPAARRKSLAAARTAGAVVAASGAVASALGLVATVACVVSAPERPLAAIDGSVEAGQGIDLTQIVALSAFGGGMAAFLLGCGAIGLARLRAEKYGALTTVDLAAAPKNLADPFRRALTAVDTIRASVAYREHWLPEIDLDAALWELAQHLLAGIRLRDELKTASAGPEYREQVEQARTALGACLMNVRKGANTLAALAHRVEVFDRMLSEPARRAEFEEARELRARSDAEQMGRLAAAVADALAIAPALGEVADRAAGALDAYDELPKMCPELHG